MVPAVMPTLANVSGIVTDPSGTPLSGVTVSIGILGTEFEGTQPTSINPTDSSGYYLITDCGVAGSGITIPGTYNVIFEKSGYQGAITTIALVTGENELNFQLSPITQPELHVTGGAIVGVNGQSLAEVGRIPEDIMVYAADGLPYLTMRSPVDYGTLDTPIVSEYLTDLVINIVDRAVASPEHQGLIAGIRFIPTTAYSPDNTHEIKTLLPPTGGASVSVPGVSALPVYLDLTFSTGSPYFPDLAGESGVTYDAHLRVDRVLANGAVISGRAVLIRNAIQCP
jgi:hypothetical protein